MSNGENKIFVKLGVAPHEWSVGEEEIKSPAYIPLCSKARIFCRLMSKALLRPLDIEIIQSLGFEIMLEDEEVMMNRFKKMGG